MPKQKEKKVCNQSIVKENKDDMPLGSLHNECCLERDVIKMEGKYRTIERNLNILCSTDQEESLYITVDLPGNVCYVGGSTLGTQFLDLHSELAEKFFSFCNDSYNGIQGDRNKTKVSIKSIQYKSHDKHNEETEAHEKQDEKTMSHDKQDEETMSHDKQNEETMSHDNDKEIELHGKQTETDSLDLIDNITSNDLSANEQTERKRRSNAKGSETGDSQKKIKMEEANRNVNNNQRRSGRLCHTSNVLLKAALRKANLNDNLGQSSRKANLIDNLGQSSQKGNLNDNLGQSSAANSDKGNEQTEINKWRKNLRTNKATNKKRKSVVNSNEDTKPLCQWEDNKTSTEEQDDSKSQKMNMRDEDTKSLCQWEDNKVSTEQQDDSKSQKMNMRDEDTKSLCQWEDNKTSTEQQDDSKSQKMDMRDKDEDQTEDLLDTDDQDRDEDYVENDDLSDDQNESMKNDVVKSKTSKVTCSECNLKFTQNQYPTHLRTVHKKLNAFKCNMCHKTFNSALGLNKHAKECSLSISTDNLQSALVDDKHMNVVKHICDPDVESKSDNKHDKSISNSASTSSLKKQKLKKTKYTCNICLRPLRTEVGLENHLKCHDKERLHCRICDKQFITRHRLKMHELVHKNEKYPCQQCPLEFNQGRYLIYHVRKAHDNHRDACYHCGTLFDSLIDKNKHMLTHMSSHCSNFICPKCGKTFELMRYLKGHNKQCHNGTEEICKICCEFFTTKEELNKHMWTHRTDFSYMCSICKKSFESSDLLTAHLKNDHNSYMYVCEACGQQFNSSVKWKKHKVYEHQPDSLFPCHICGSKFMQERKLKLHLERVHREDRPYQCEECGMCFKTMATMRKHSTTHNADHWNPCQFCDAKFRSLDGLHNHILDQHSDKINLERLNFRVYECEFCGKRSSQKHIYIRHKRTHTGEKPYVCSVCDRKFPLPAALNRHMKHKHLERSSRFECETCGIRFVQNSHLQRHYGTQAHQHKISSLSENKHYVEKSDSHTTSSSHKNVLSNPNNLTKDNIDPGIEQQMSEIHVNILKKAANEINHINDVKEENMKIITLNPDSELLENSSILHLPDSTIYMYVLAEDSPDIQYVQVGEDQTS